MGEGGPSQLRTKADKGREFDCMRTSTFVVIAASIDFINAGHLRFDILILIHPIKYWKLNHALHLSTPTRSIQ